MAKTQHAAEVSEDEVDYEVEAIRKHKREAGKLHYFVSWVGYPSSEPGNDTWIPEEDAAGADEIVDAYWKSLPASKQSARYAAAPVSKGKSSAKSTPATSVSKSAKRSASNADEDNSDDEEIKSASKSNGAKKSKKNDGAGKKAAKVVTPKAAKVASAVAKLKGIKAETKAARRAPSSDDEEEQEADEEEEEGEEEEVEEEEPAFDVADGYNVEGRTCKHHENDYKEIMDWEPLVKAIDTVERSDDNVLKLFVIWQEDDSYSWVESEMARRRCPQKVIDFYENHLKFKVKDEDEEVV